MSPPDTEIAIVGAGAAGIAAALTAQAHGLPFRLIEARQRSGGRIWTTTTAMGRPFDLGASWIHAVDAGNPFAEIALARDARPVVDRRRRVILDSAGRPLGARAEAAYAAARDRGIARIEQAPPGSSLVDCLPVGPNQPVAPNQEVPDQEARHPEARHADSGDGETGDLEAAAPAAGELWGWTVRSFAGPWLCGTDCAATDAADWAAAKAGIDWLLPDGYGTLVQQVAAALPMTTGCALEALDIGPDAVELVTANGSFTARHVVLTVPLGVLAAERIRVTPALPHPWIRALDDLPMGCLMKVAIDLLADPLDGLMPDGLMPDGLPLDGTTLDRQVPDGQVLGDLADRSTSCFLHYPATDERAVLYLLRPCGHAMAYAFVGGSMARALEPEADAAIRDVVLEPLRQRLGSARVARAFGPARVSRWGSDPFAFGSYAVARPGGAGARAVLAEPLFERLHLAGEATAPDGWYGTAGGAWLAGRAAVTRIAAAALGS